MQQLTPLVQNQLAHIGMLTEAIEGMREADKERGDELRQLRTMVAALGAGALLWRSDPGFLAELPAGSSVEGRDEAQEAAPVLAATNLSSLEGLQAGEAAVRQAGERPRDVVRRNASSSTVACGGGGSGLVACVRFRCRKLTPPALHVACCMSMLASQCQVRCRNCSTARLLLACEIRTP